MITCPSRIVFTSDTIEIYALGPDGTEYNARYPMRHEDPDCDLSHYVGFIIPHFLVAVNRHDTQAESMTP